jgi:hypothetical protein
MGSEAATWGEGLPAELASLTPVEREVLAALAVVGQAALSPEQLTALTSVADPEPTLAELERLGFIQREDDDRRAVVPGLREQIKQAWDLVDTGDKILRQLISIAADGRLTLSDLDAVLGVTEWAAETGRFVELLRLVRTVRQTMDVIRRVEAWVPIVRRAVDAARALGDHDAEAWAEGELSECARAVDDAASAAAHEERRAEALRRVASQSTAPTGRWVRLPAGARVRIERVPRWVIRFVAVAIAAAAGVGAGLVLSDIGRSSPRASTVTLPRTTETQTVTAAAQTVTVTVGGKTVTVGGGSKTVTVTQPGSTTTVTIPGKETTSISTSTVTVFTSSGPG